MAESMRGVACINGAFVPAEEAAVSMHFSGAPFELKAELAKEINRPSEVIDDDSYVVHPFERHVSNLQGVV